ncbi:MAG TPA: glycosyltransferase family 39 protein [Thermoanaerobaculia bacterium]|nr:glycosyltransferase family 39 protein [Thermoanaerobaculia bacterium]
MRHPASAGRGAFLAALLLFTALALFGQRYHWVEEAGTAERDGYVEQAEQLLHGSLPRDPFRPLLYPILAAGLAKVTGDPFAAARLLSNLAAAALAWLAYAHGRRLAGPAAGDWAMALAAANPNLWIIGQHTTTDMLFAAFAAGALLAGLAYLEAADWQAALAAGLALGLAAFTRANSLFLVPALLLAWWLAPGARRRRLGHLAAAVIAWAAVLLPHWMLRARLFGDPFYDENWKNLAFKLHGFPDWSYLARVPYRGALEILAESPGAVLRGGIAELWRFAIGGGAAQLLGTWAHVALFAAGALWALHYRRHPAAWLLLAGGIFLAATAFAFFAWGRFLLLLLPPAYALAFAPMAAVPPGSAPAAPAGSPPKETAPEETAPARPPALGQRRLRMLMTAVALAAVAGLAVKTFAFRLPAFIARHPYVEVATLRQLDRALPPGAALGGTSPFLGRYLHDRRYLALPDAFGPEIAQPELYFEHLHRLLQSSRVAYLVIGAVDLRDRPPSLAAAPPAPSPAPWLIRAAAGRGATVWRVALQP